MTAILDHSPASILRQMLVDLGLGTNPSAKGSWPVHASAEPDDPDGVITIYDTESIKQGRVQIDGEVQEHYGFQVRVRDYGHATGYAKASAVAYALDRSVYDTMVTIGSSVYCVHSISRTGGVLSLGRDKPGSNRRIFTTNAVASLRQV